MPNHKCRKYQRNICNVRCIHQVSISYKVIPLNNSNENTTNYQRDNQDLSGSDERDPNYKEDRLERQGNKQKHSRFQFNSTLNNKTEINTNIQIKQEVASVIQGMFRWMKLNVIFG